jgi:hypothetical protein
VEIYFFVVEENVKLQQEIKEENNKEPFNPLIMTRSRRISRPIDRYVTTHYGHLQTQSIESQKYSWDSAKVIVNTIAMINQQFA